MEAGVVRSDRMLAAVVTRSRAWMRWGLGARVSEIDGERRDCGTAHTKGPSPWDFALRPRGRVGPPGRPRNLSGIRHGRQVQFLDGLGLDRSAGGGHKGNEGEGDNLHIVSTELQRLAAVRDNLRAHRGLSCRPLGHMTEAVASAQDTAFKLERRSGYLTPKNQSAMRQSFTCPGAMGRSIFIIHLL